MSAETRHRLVAWLQTTDFSASIESVPKQFVVLFDRVFGEKHLSWRCFASSALASASTVALVTLLWTVAHPPDSAAFARGTTAWLTLAVIGVNLIPDYLSLLETRYLLARLEGSGRLPTLLVVDIGITAVLGFAGYLVAYLAANDATVTEIPNLSWQTVTLRSRITVEMTAGVDQSIPIGLFFYSTFFTSAWLWLYCGAVMVSRVLLRMNSGLGFVLRATDVEYQPFRALGFVSVTLVLALFLAGLPILLL